MATTYICPKCRGTDVEELRLVWVNPNTGSHDDSYGLAELYPDVYWCYDCGEHLEDLIQTETPT